MLYPELLQKSKNKSNWFKTWRKTSRDSAYKEELNKSIEYRDYYKINFDNRDLNYENFSPRVKKQNKSRLYL